MAMCRFIATIFLLLACQSEALVKWSNVATRNNDTIFLADELVYTASHNQSRQYADMQRKFSKYSVDEKCIMGLNMSFGFLPYMSYIDLGAPPLTLMGIVPSLINKYLGHCCPKTKVTYGQVFGTLYEIEAYFGNPTDHDLTFPIYALKGKETTTFKGRPIIPIVQAPKVILLVRNSVFVEMDTRTQVLMRTIFNAWPMLIFIFVSACLSGLLVWMLDRKQNSSEFPPAFYHGAWEGFWWAFVTMTTVGYGDRSPKSALARAFCIIWILAGVIIISLFTGLVSAALSTSAKPVFNIPGAKIGAVTGSQEFELGVNMHADMTAYGSVPLLFEGVLSKKLQGILVDNFILAGAAHTEQMQQLRMYKEFAKPITYGLALGRNSSRVEQCFRTYLNDYPQETFSAIAKHLKPFKSTADDVSVEVQSAEKLFYEEKIFKLVVYSEVGILLVFMLTGTIWEYCIRHNAAGKYRMMLQRSWRRKDDGRKAANGKQVLFDLENGSTLIDSGQEFTDLLREYDAFHNDWMNRARLSRLMKERANSATSRSTAQCDSRL